MTSLAMFRPSTKFIAKILTVILINVLLILMKPKNVKVLTRLNEIREQSSAEASSISSDIVMRPSALSAFAVMGFSNISLMKRQAVPRAKIDFLRIPRSVNCSGVLQEKEALWSMIVCVKSNVFSIARRNLIRMTWASKKYILGVHLEVMFIIGVDQKVNDEEIRKESLKHGDLLQINSTEVYRNVGYKVLGGMQWVKQHCPNHWMYASADDDMVPDLRKVFREIQIEMSMNLEFVPIICHFILRHNSPSREIKTKNYVSEEFYSKDTYPTFCSGGFYSMSVSVANALFDISRWHEYFYNDDVWFTALLRLSAVDARLINCNNITDEHCALSEVKGGSVEHTEGQEKILEHKLRKKYA